MHKALPDKRNISVPATLKKGSDDLPGHRTMVYQNGENGFLTAGQQPYGTANSRDCR
jgi:hypothetical protein